MPATKAYYRTFALLRYFTRSTDSLYNRREYDENNLMAQTLRRIL
jgi:hypothetical protein